MSYVLTPEEKEVTCVFNEATRRWRIYSSCPRMTKKISKLFENSDSEAKIIKKDDSSITIEVPEKYVEIAIPRKRNISDEQREALKERMSSMRRADFDQA